MLVDYPLSDHVTESLARLTGDEQKPLGESMAGKNVAIDPLPPGCTAPVDRHAVGDRATESSTSPR